MESDSCVREWSRTLQIQSNMRPVFHFTCVLVLSTSNLSPIPHSLPSTVCFCFSGYSCRLVTHHMSLIIVNEDSLDVSRPSSSYCRPPSFTSVYTLYSIGTICVCTGGRGLCGGVLNKLLWELGCGPQPDWWVGLFCVLTGAGN